MSLSRDLSSLIVHRFQTSLLMPEMEYHRFCLHHQRLQAHHSELQQLFQQTNDFLDQRSCFTLYLYHQLIMFYFQVPDIVDQSYTVDDAVQFCQNGVENLITLCYDVHPFLLEPSELSCAIQSRPGLPTIGPSYLNTRVSSARVLRNLLSLGQVYSHSKWRELQSKMRFLSEDSLRMDHRLDSLLPQLTEPWIVNDVMDDLDQIRASLARGDLVTMQGTRKYVSDHVEYLIYLLETSIDRDEILDLDLLAFEMYDY